jgi:hypothetical protein
MSSELLLTHTTKTADSGMKGFQVFAPEPVLADFVRAEGAASLQSDRLRSCRGDRPSELPADGVP